MGSYIMTKARKLALRKAQEKAWAMRRGTKAATKAIPKAAKMSAFEAMSNKEKIANIGKALEGKSRADLIKMYKSITRVGVGGKGKTMSTRHIKTVVTDRMFRNKRTYSKYIK
jgi:hypothetical protein